MSDRFSLDITSAKPLVRMKSKTSKSLHSNSIRNVPVVRTRQRGSADIISGETLPQQCLESEFNNRSGVTRYNLKLPNRVKAVRSSVVKLMSRTRGGELCPTTRLGERGLEYVHNAESPGKRSD